MAKRYIQAEMLAEALLKRHFSVERLSLGGETFFKFSKDGESWLTSGCKITYPFRGSAARSICSNKIASHDIASRIGIETPITRVVRQGSSQETEALNMLDEYDSLIVKPYDSRGSRGLTSNVKTESQLRSALDRSWKFSPVALVQEQFMGEELRFTVLDGEVVSALLRRTPRVVGDNKSNLRELITLEDKERRMITGSYVDYPLLEDIFTNVAKRRGDHVPSHDEVVELSNSTMISGGASVYEVLHKVHSTYIAAAARLASELGNGFFSVDLMIKDFTKPQSKGNYVFIEFNSSPSLRMYYSCRDGMHFDILSKLAQSIENKLALGY